MWAAMGEGDTVSGGGEGVWTLKKEGYASRTCCAHAAGEEGGLVGGGLYLSGCARGMEGGGAFA